MNVWVYYLYWSNKYPVGPDDPVCRVATIKRNQTEIVKQQIPDALEEDKEWVLKVVPNHCIYNVALNMRQLWLKYLIQHSFVESNYELKSLLWFHLQILPKKLQVRNAGFRVFLKASLHDRGLLEFLEGHISKDC